MNTSEKWIRCPHCDKDLTNVVHADLIREWQQWPRHGIWNGKRFLTDDDGRLLKFVNQVQAEMAIASMHGAANLASRKIPIRTLLKDLS